MPVESSAFNELAGNRRSGSRARLALTPRHRTRRPATSSEPPDPDEAQRQPGEQPGWLSAPEPPARGDARRDRMLLDLVRGRRADLSAGPDALCQPRVSRSDADTRASTPWKRPEVSMRSMSSPASPTPPARRRPDPREDFRNGDIVRKCDGRGRRPPVHDFMGRRFRAGLDLLRRPDERPRPSPPHFPKRPPPPQRRPQATPMPRTSAPSSTPRPRES